MAGLTASDGLDALSDCSPAQVLDLMSKEGRSLLLYLESCAVDCKGIVDVARMNESDVAVAKDWTRRGFIEFCRLKASMLPKQLPRPEARCPTHAVRLAGRAWECAALERRRRAVRSMSTDAMESLEFHRAKQGASVV
jgi:hypothetical protein